MSEDLVIQGSTREEIYTSLYPQIDALISPESNLIANLGNIAAALKEAFGFFWVGFYLLHDKELVLGPFQGPVACTRIQHGRGVCGAAWASGKTQLVPDVDQFPGHIACSSISKSEVVIPIFVNTTFVAVLDVDSDKLNDFSQVDVEQLEKICQLISKKWDFA